MALIFHDDCSSLDNWTICTDESHVHYGELFADGDCIYITQENINNNFYDSRQDFYQDCLIGLQDFILEAQIKYEYSKPQREQVASITLYNTENSWERIGFTICPNIDYSGTKGGLYCTNAGSFTFSQNLNYTDDILTYKLCRTGNVLDLYINDIKRGTYENSEIGLVNISGININLGKSRLTDESSLKIPAIYDINISQPPYQFAHGSGTEEDPYQVWTSNDLNGVRDYLDAHFIQMADIDLSGYENWTPIGAGTSEEDFFAGSYDGNGYSISNLISTQLMFAGLFGIIWGSCVIKNIAIVDCDITSNVIAGGLSASVGNGVTIRNCMSSGVVTVNISNEDLDYTAVGGLIGLISPFYDEGIIPSVENCFSTCSVSATNSSETYGVQAGGLIGVVEGYYSENTNPPIDRRCSITNCYSMGLVTATSAMYTSKGGLVAIDWDGIYTSCYYDSETSGCSDTDKGTPKTTAQMKSEATYDGWDFTDIWAIDPAINDGYPYLRVFDKQEGISLNISIEGNGVTTPSAGTSYYEEGTKVLLTAKPGEGNKFIRWEGEGIEDTGGRVTRITMNGNKTVKAVFGEAVTLNLIAAGGGTTIPAPGKLTFAKGDVISLKGVPHKGFKFKEWMGDIIHTHDVQQFIIYDDMMVRAVFEEADEERRSPKRLYFATVKEKAFWRVDGKWRFFATPVHSNMKNLSADDHKQYLTAERHDNTGRHTLGEVIPHDSHMNLLDRGIFTHSQIDNHLENLSNPHKVTAEQIGGASYESGPALPDPSEDYKGCFFSLVGDGVDEKLYYCRLKSDGETYEWKEIF